MSRGGAGKPLPRGQVTEVINRNALVSRALQQGYNAYLPVCDLGIDLILHREEDGDTRLIQLKSRWTIDRKYERRSIWVAFPDGEDWIVAPHDLMVEHAKALGLTKSASWTMRGFYHRAPLSKALRQYLQDYRF